MKKIFTLTLVFSALFFCVQGQISKGSKLLGGYFSAYFSSQNNGSSQASSNAGIHPSFSIAIKDNLALGARGFFNYLHTTSDNLDRDNFDVGLGAFLRKYSFVKGRFGLYFDNQLSGNYGINVEEYSGNKSNYTSWGASYSFTPGLFYQFTKSFMGEANIGGVGVGYTQADNGGVYKMWSISASFLSAFGVGLNFIL